MNSKEYEVKNALITSTSLGNRGDNHGCFSFWLYLKYDDEGQGFGGYALDGKPDPGSYDRKPEAYGMAVIMGIMDAVGAYSWEDLTGMHCRVLAKHDKVKSIGHIIKDQWFDIDECAKEWNSAD